MELIELIKKYLPSTKVITMYARTDNIASKSDEDLRTFKKNCSYFEALEQKAEDMAKKYDCPFVDNEMPYIRQCSLACSY